jgi:hypothetical protein
VRELREELDGVKAQLKTLVDAVAKMLKTDTGDQ